MHLRYINKVGITKEIELTEEPVIIGRSREADVSLMDEKVSRVHCGIRMSDGEYYLKDLKARNGTFVNGKRVEDTVKLAPGDRIQVGSTTFVLERESEAQDAANALTSVESDMGDGKGYSTILKEIVADLDPNPVPPPVATVTSTSALGAPSAASKPAVKLSSSIKINPPVRKITIKKPSSGSSQENS